MQKLEKQFHIHCVPGDVGRYCILPGDPGRVPAIAALFDDAHQVAYNREFNVWTGTLLGEKVTACSTGIGGLCRVESADTLRQVVHRIPRRFLFIRWGTKALRQEIVPSNPHTRIVYSEYVKIER